MSTFLFIHGAGGTKNKWRTLSSLENESSFIDLPGHGTNKSIQCETIEEYAAVLSKEITKDCIVVGHSMGGLIAIELAARNPNVKGIVLAASSYSLPVHPNIIASLEEGKFPDFLFRASYAKGANPQLIAEEEQELATSSPNIAKKDFQACDRYKNGEATLRKIEIPILALLGDEDRLIPPDTNEKLQAFNDNLEITMVEGAGHYIALEKPEVVEQELLKFKASVLK